MKFQLLFTKIIFELYLKFVERCLPNEQNQSLGERNRGPITLDLHFFDSVYNSNWCVFPCKGNSNEVIY